MGAPREASPALGPGSLRGHPSPPAACARPSRAEILIPFRNAVSCNPSGPGCRFSEKEKRKRIRKHAPSALTFRAAPVGGTGGSRSGREGCGPAAGTQRGDLRASTPRRPRSPETLGKCCERPGACPGLRRHLTAFDSVLAPHQGTPGSKRALPPLPPVHPLGPPPTPSSPRILPLLLQGSCLPGSAACDTWGSRSLSLGFSLPVCETGRREARRSAENRLAPSTSTQRGRRRQA